MVYWRVALLLVLAVLPTALSQINGYGDPFYPKQAFAAPLLPSFTQLRPSTDGGRTSDGAGHVSQSRNEPAPYRTVYECRGLPEQVYAVRNEVGAVRALLQNATADSTTVLENQETLITISGTLIDRRDEVRFVVQDIRQEQAVNLNASLGALSALQGTMLQELGNISDDVAEMQAHQKVLTATLTETAADLAAGHEDISQEVSEAKRQLQDVNGLLLQGIHNTENLRVYVRGLVNFFQGSARVIGY